MYPVVPFAVLPVRYSLFTEFMGVMDLIDTRKFYKVYFVASGPSIISINDRLFVLEAGDIIFYRPGDQFTFEIGKMGNAFLCLVHTEYLSGDSAYLLDLFRHFPLYPFHRAIIALDSKQAEIVRHSFESIIVEQKSKNADKKYATLLYLQMILLQIRRAGRRDNYVSAAGNSMGICCFTIQPFSFSLT
jgi:AraC family transcriptional activator of pobA